MRWDGMWDGIIKEEMGCDEIELMGWDGMGWDGM